MSDNNKSIFGKVVEAGEAWLDHQILKAKNISSANSVPEEEGDEALYGKAVLTDQVHQTHSGGYKERTNSLQPNTLKAMSRKDSIIAAIIQTRQNHVSNYSSPSRDDRAAGFMIELKNYEASLEATKLTIKIEQDQASDEDKERLKELGVNPESIEVKPKEKPEEEEESDEEVEIDPEITEKSMVLRKADEAKGVDDELEDENNVVDNSEQPEQEEDFSEQKDQEEKEQETPTDDQDTDHMSADDMAEIDDFELERQAKERLNKEIEEKRKKIEEFVLNCGEIDDRPFDSKKWNFDSFLRAMTRDTLTYDFMTMEVVRDQADRPHHFFPVDASTIRFAAPSLKQYKSLPSAQYPLDITYPEKEGEYLQSKDSDALELDEEKLDDDEYKYVQVIRGVLERAFTAKELKVGIRNPTTDIYSNGYGISELELLLTLVTSHLNTEYYNQAYFTQGFSAKGILHLKAPVNRRKLETIRLQWQHMLKGAKNSFQTPIFAGMDDVNWIPLTQNHSDIEFQGWMHYLIKLMCAVYQIDPSEIGYGMNEEGGSGGGLSGDNTAEKVQLSRDKGLFPLMRFVENYININIIDLLDKDFKLTFTGLSGESTSETLDRLEREAKIAKTVNEVREEMGLKPLPGMDDFINEPTYLQWYTSFSDKGQKLAEKTQKDQMDMQSAGQQEQGFGGGDEGGEDFTSNPDYGQEFDDALSPEDGFDKSLRKSKKPIRIEYYKL